MAKKSIDDQIQDRISSFVDELSDLVKAAAVEAVQEALGGRVPSSAKVAVSRGRSSVTRKAAKPGKRIRRTAADLEADKQALVDYVKANPGQRLEEISSGMGINSKDLKRPALLLLGEGVLRKEGERRGTRYFPGGRGAKAAGGAKKKAKARKSKKKGGGKKA